MKYNKTDAERLLLEINSWIISCDSKASILMAFLAIFAGLTTSVFDIFEMISAKLLGGGVDIFVGIIFILLICFYFLCFIGVIGFLGGVLFARTKSMIKFKKEKGLNTASPLYFGSIANLNIDEFQQKTQDLTEEKLLKELNEQCIITSKIASIKYKSFNFALIFSIAFAISTLVLLALVHI